MTREPFREAPAPDYPAFERMLRGLEPPSRVHVCELRMDEEIVRFGTENFFGEPWVERAQDPAAYHGQFVRFAARLGYDMYCYWGFPWIGLPALPERVGADTAALGAGTRSWVAEGGGLIAGRADLEAFPWEAVGFDLAPLEAMEVALPAGMRLAVSTHFFAFVFQKLLGEAPTFLLSHDDPGLVREALDRWGEQVLGYYAACLQRPSVAAVFHSDDFGHKTGTLMSPAFLREYVFPWLRRFADLAHASGKLFVLHSCGNTLEIMEDLIEDVKIDAYHSFQDVIMPVAEFQRRHGDRIGVIGGVDMDALGRMPEPQFREYVRGILGQCQPRGRYALGAGNSLANYVLPENYLAMLEEGWRWEPGR
jgi:uroporphyrinogen decarboxylase